MVDSPRVSSNGRVPANGKVQSETTAKAIQKAEAEIIGKYRIGRPPVYLARHGQVIRFTIEVDGDEYDALARGDLADRIATLEDKVDVIVRGTLKRHVWKLPRKITRSATIIEVESLEVINPKQTPEDIV